MRRVNLKRIRSELAILVVLSAMISWSSWTGDYEGGDIAAARKSYLSFYPIDIWGGFSGFFYGNVPNFFFNWGLNLLLFQMICTTVGLFLIRTEFYGKKSKYISIGYLTCSFVILNFVSYLTRDSTILSLLILGLGIFIKGLKVTLKYRRNLFLICGVFVMTIACAFRPWVSLSIAVLILALITLLTTGSNRVLKVFLFVILAISPLTLDALTYLNNDMRRVHPELQVIAMDATSFACYSNDSEPQTKGMEILSKINNEEINRSQVCANYRPNTWQSVAYWKLSAEDASSLGVENLSDKTLNNKIAIKTDIQKSNYNNVRNQWIKTILSEPKSYFQIKLSQFAQVMVAGDTVGFRIFNLTNQVNAISLVKAIFLSPYDLIISLHLISPIVVLFLGWSFMIFSLREFKIKEIFGRSDLAYFLSFPMVWFTATTIAFIGDNGRYIYAACLLFLVLLPGFISNVSDRMLKRNDN